MSLLNRLRTLTISQRNVLIASWLVLTCNAAFFQRLSELTPYDGWRAGVFLVATGLMLIAYIASFLQVLTWGVFARPLQSFVLLASALTTYFMSTYGVGIDAGQIQNMMETNPQEVWDLMSWRLLATLLVIAGLPMLWLWTVPATPLSWRATLRSKAIALVLGLVTILALAGWHYADYASTFREHRELRYLVVPHNYIAGLKRYYSKMATPAHLPLLSFGEDATRTTAATKKTHAVCLCAG